MPQEVKIVDEGTMHFVQPVKGRGDILRKSPKAFLFSEAENPSGIDRRILYEKMLQRFYLHKAVEILFPGFLAQLKVSSIDKALFEHQYVENLFPLMSDDEFELRQLLFRSKREDLTEDEISKAQQLWQEHVEKVTSDEILQKKIYRLEQAGFILDSQNPLNFSYINDEAVYIDQLEGTIDYRLLMDAARYWLAKKPSLQRRALRYLTRAAQLAR